MKMAYWPKRHGPRAGRHEVNQDLIGPLAVVDVAQQRASGQNQRQAFLAGGVGAAELEDGLVVLAVGLGVQCRSPSGWRQGLRCRVCPWRGSAR